MMQDGVLFMTRTLNDVLSLQKGYKIYDYICICFNNQIITSNINAVYFLYYIIAI